jgi:hypothetical protein
VERFKPGVKQRVHLFTAPFVWAVVGGILMVRGWHWLPPGSGLLCMVAGGLAGTGKSLLILDRMARKSVTRLGALPDGTCLGAVYPWRTWLLIGCMMGAGMSLRRITHPGALLGTLYMAVGWSLLFSSRLGWRAWLNKVQHDAIA